MMLAIACVQCRTNSNLCPPSRRASRTVSSIVYSRMINTPSIVRGCRILVCPLYSIHISESVLCCTQSQKKKMNRKKRTHRILARRRTWTTLPKSPEHAIHPSHQCIAYTTHTTKCGVYRMLYYMCTMHVLVLSAESERANNRLRRRATSFRICRRRLDRKTQNFSFQFIRQPQTFPFISSSTSPR